MRKQVSRFREEFGEFLERKRKALDLPQVTFAGRLKVSFSYYSRLRGGTVPPKERIEEMARNLGDDVQEWLVAAGYEGIHYETAKDDIPKIEDTSGAYVPRPSTEKLPIMGILKGGALEMAAQVREDEYFSCLPEHAAGSDYVVRIEGESLYPLVLPGDFVAVRRTSAAEVGELVVAEVGDSTMLKRYGGIKEGKIHLEPINPDYPIIKADGNVKIVGVVTWIHRTANVVRGFGR
jgi:SOS-response transcriptional repressor LexA